MPVLGFFLGNNGDVYRKLGIKQASSPSYNKFLALWISIGYKNIDRLGHSTRTTIHPKVTMRNSTRSSKESVRIQH